MTDRQRIELAIPAYLLYAIVSVPGAFTPADPALATKAKADIAELCVNLRTACLEPFADLIPSNRQALVRRLERITRRVTADRRERPARCSPAYRPRAYTADLINNFPKSIGSQTAFRF